MTNILKSQALSSILTDLNGLASQDCLGLFLLSSIPVILGKKSSPLYSTKLFLQISYKVSKELIFSLALSISLKSPASRATCTFYFFLFFVNSLKKDVNQVTKYMLLLSNKCDSLTEAKKIWLRKISWLCLSAKNVDHSIIWKINFFYLPLHTDKLLFFLHLF